MTYMAYIPIDDTARSGRGFCLRGNDGRLYAGHWHAGAGRFEYSSGTPIPATITHYCARLPGAPPEAEERYV